MREETIASAVLFVALAGLIAWVLATGSGGDRDAAGDAGSPPVAAPGVDEQSVARFWQTVAEHKTHFEMVAHVCPVDATALDVPALIDTNRLGGVATDMMKLSVAPNPDNIGPPDLSQQDFVLQYGTCPKCGATFTELDMTTLGAQPVRDRLARWDLRKLAPALSARPQGQWTVDERALVRYLTLRQAGTSQVELGIAALQGAYACNLATSVGQKRRFVSAAFYALAAAHFRTAAADTADPSTTGFAALMLGECARLLGRVEEARVALSQARRSGQLDDAAKAVLSQIDGLLGDGNLDLVRAELPGVSTPPTGWYLNDLLPAINADIAVCRKDWAELPDAQAVLAKMQQRLAE
jgi:hypothetical protein